MAELLPGIATVLFTNIEGTTERWRYCQGMAAAIADYIALLDAADPDQTRAPAPWVPAAGCSHSRY